jgi:hypothetical protein
MFKFLKKITGGGKDKECGMGHCGSEKAAPQKEEMKMDGGCCGHGHHHHHHEAEEDNTAPRGTCH